MKAIGTQLLETDRLILRRATLDDAEPMFRNWASDPEVTKYLTWPPYENAAGVEEFIREQIGLWQSDDHYNWFIELKDIGEVIGTIGYVRTNAEIESFDVGYVIGRAWWGKGIVPEALEEILRFAFEEVGAKRVGSQHDVPNPNSGRVMLKCGMKFEGVLRQAGKNNRGIIDVCQHSITAEEYFARRGSEQVRANDVLSRAAAYAAHCHAGQMRKGSGMPYTIHPMEAASICASFTDDLEVIAAAMLHDVVEDTDASVEGVRELFGERVALLVAGESEDKREHLPAAETWKIRKEESIEHLQAAEDPGVRMVCLGDKLSNIRSIQRDYERLGDKLWQRFNQKDPAEHAWYYRAIADVLKGELGETEAWNEFSQRVRAVFGPRLTRGNRNSHVTLLELKQWCDRLLDLGVDLDTKVVIGRSKELEGYTYVDDLHFDSFRHPGNPTVLIGSYRAHDARAIELEP